MKIISRIYLGLFVLALAFSSLSPAVAKKPSLQSLSIRLAKLFDAGQFKKALPVARRLAKRVRARYGARHKNYAQILKFQAAIENSLGLRKDYEQHIREVVKIYGSKRGGNQGQLLVPLIGLAQLLIATNRLDEALRHAKRAAIIAQETLDDKHPLLAQSLATLANILQRSQRNREAAPILRRIVELDRRNLGEKHPNYATSLNNFAQLLQSLGRMDDARSKMREALAVTENIFGPDHPIVADRLNNLSTMYPPSKDADGPLPMLLRAMAIHEKQFGADHPSIARDLNNLGQFLVAAGEFSDAVPVMQRALAILERQEPELNPFYTTALTNLASLLRRLKRWDEALAHRRKAFPLLVGRGTAGSLRHVTLANNQGSFLAHAQAAYHSGPGDNARQDEGFRLAQWAMQGRAAAALHQMATRFAKGRGGLSNIVRKKQSIEEMLAALDQQLFQTLGRGGAARTTAIRKRRQELAGRLVKLDRRLGSDFPNYAALVHPKPLSIIETQQLLKPDEALVLFMAVPATGGYRDESLVWVVTKTKSRWVAIPLGPDSAYWEVAALRCGLDYAGSWLAQAGRCRGLLGIKYTDAEFQAGEPLPFDVARAHRLYKTLFGKIEDLVQDKHLLIVPSRALAQLPFHVLVTELDVPLTPPSDAKSKKAEAGGWLGLSFRFLGAAITKRLGLRAKRAIGISATKPGGPAARAGLLGGDVVVAVDGSKIENGRAFSNILKNKPPGSKVRLKTWRRGRVMEIVATLGRDQLLPKSPPFSGHADYQNVAWLAQRFDTSVLPAVASLKALRVHAKASAATLPLIGFANPLLDGDKRFSWEVAAARRSRLIKTCASAGNIQTAALRNTRPRRRNVSAKPNDARLAMLDHLRSQPPLPETADEVCEVARAVNAEAGDMHLGARGTESALKRLSKDGKLAQYRLIHFATHGVLAGQIAGTNEPGLILTPPDKATSKDDGYLSASEIANLKLDADWVILSACNTAAGRSQDSEMLSGLARAFFYAGARALLVSHWAVNSTAAVRLITTALREQNTGEGREGRAAALARSIAGHDRRRRL